MTTLPHQSRKTRARIFFLESPFAPLILRIINLIFVVSTLGLAASIMRQETANGIRGVVGSSIIFCLSIAPIAVLHIGVVLYVSPRPLDLRSVQLTNWNDSWNTLANPLDSGRSKRNYGSLSPNCSSSVSGPRSSPSPSTTSSTPPSPVRISRLTNVTTIFRIELSN